MKYVISFLSSFLLVCSLMQAQTLNDALRYSDFSLGGSARSVAVGNSLGALGADFTVLSTNPAGLAQFRSSNFSITPSLFFNEADSRLQVPGSTVSNEMKTNFNFSNLGLVLASKPSSSKWRTANIGIGFNRLANFHRTFYGKGVAKGSIVDRWVFETNNAGGALNDFETGPASDAFAIYTDGVNPEITSDFELKPDADIEIEQEFKSSGSMNELVIGYAGNYREKLMLGISIGIPFISYDEEKTYRETDIDEIPFFNELAYQENLSTSGVGVNVKLGMIYRFNQNVRMGVAVHTPTTFSLTDNFNTSVTYDYTDADNDGPVTGTSPEGTFEYRFRTPWKFIGSAGFLINKKGFISAEVEFLDYTGNNFNLTANSTAQGDREFQEQLNAEIDQDFQSAVNLRIGGEYAINNKLRARAGYNRKGSARDLVDVGANVYSVGFGLQEQSFSVDLAFQRTEMKEEFVPYVLNGAPGQIFENEFATNQVLLSFGFRF